MEKGKRKAELIADLTEEAASLKALEEKIREMRQEIEAHLRVLIHQKTIEETARPSSE
jgi:hypothetical protein